MFRHTAPIVLPKPAIILRIDLSIAPRLVIARAGPLSLRSPPRKTGTDAPITPRAVPATEAALWAARIRQGQGKYRRGRPFRRQPLPRLPSAYRASWPRTIRSSSARKRWDLRIVRELFAACGSSTLSGASTRRCAGVSKNFHFVLSRQSRNQRGGRKQNSSSAVRAILDDPPIHIRPVCSRKRGCEGQEPCGFNAFQHAHGCTPPPLRPQDSSQVLSRVSS
jgi:hypothetical protein